MKKLKMKYILGSFIIASIFGVLSSCSNDNNTGSSGIPAVVSVSKAVAGDLTPVTLGVPKNVYIIKGSGFSTLQKIYFNDFDTYFNPTLVTDTAIFVTIDEKTPYANASNELKIVTKGGTVVYHFVIAPPPPTFGSYNPINPAAGDVITIYGNYFLDPIVKIGGVTATIISSTLTEIKVKVPTGSNDKYVSVSNISGTAIAPEAIGSALYDDTLQGDAGHWLWSSSDTWDLNFKDDKVQGLNSMKIGFGGWNGLDMKFTSRDISKYKAFRVKVKSISKNANASIVFVFGGWAYQIKKSFTTEWTYIEIPFSNIGNPTTWDQLTLQESGNFGGNTILMDDMGFVLK